MKMQYMIYTVAAFWYFDHSLQTLRTMSGHMQRYCLIMHILLVCITQCWENLTIICARLARSSRHNSGFRVHLCQIHLSNSVRKQYFKHSLSIPFFRSKLPGCVSVLTALWRKYKLTLSCSYKASTHWRSGRTGSRMFSTKSLSRTRTLRITAKQPDTFYSNGRSIGKCFTKKVFCTVVPITGY